MKVLKFGGTSVSDATNLSRVLDIISGAAGKDRVVLVSSAMSGVTDSLVCLCGLCASRNNELYDVIGRIRSRHYAAARRLFTGKELEDVALRLDGHIDRLIDMCLHFEDGLVMEIEGTGELLSTTLLAAKLVSEGQSAVWLDSREMIVKDDLSLTYKNIRHAVDTRPDVRIFVVPGFIARDSGGNICTLGRGGSDYSAALFAAALGSDDLQIWTDVSGIMTANPKEVASARKIERMSYEAASDMASNGAKVLYAPTVNPAREAGIPIRILNTFRPQDEGTVICKQQAPRQCRWIGLASALRGDMAQLTLVSEGPLEGSYAITRAESALLQAGIAPSGSSCEGNCVRLSVKAELSQASQLALHNEFFGRTGSRRVNIYVAGYGKVGHALETLLRGDMAQRSDKTLILKAISSDRGFVGSLLAKPDRGAVFVDCTDSEDIWKYYTALLDAGYNIVSSNRRSIAVPYVQYRAMKQAALRNGLFLRYETTVGASLPMLGTIARSSSCGDKVSSIEAVVSCTLNYILSSHLPFREALTEARDAGLTEKDPQDDLGGRDALRKLLILAREAGVPLDADDVCIEPLSEDSEPEKDMRFVASIEEDRTAATGYRASIALRKVGPEHPAHWLRGTDNAIIIRTLYHPTPLVILGPGEGSDLAASSILNDILL